ncbi:hypothetical protein [Formosa sp. PL04]|uniref:hypothetical protein n=1 Tax=Formosa sp. PL04 TaxID=3081755 RepID=UPI002981BAF6|nr:hypothetical protein [Formosa sp. PL04]MDW5289627.1 hypothetical protein [Formosa sp. PL04]
MKIINYIAIFSLIVIFSSFQITSLKTSDLLFQKWVYEGYQNGNLLYESQLDFTEDKAGIEFKNNGTLSLKQNSGSCGTPPITYKTISGTWKNISDSILEIEYKNWSGLTKDTLQIVNVSKTKLTLKQIHTVRKN